MNIFLRAMLIRHEGWINKPYKCTAKKWTIGVGHNFTDNPLPKEMEEYLEAHGEITDEMVEQLLESDVDAAIRHCKRIYPKFSSFSEKRKFALIDFVFNVGKGTALTFVQTNKAMDEGRWDDAAHLLSHSKYWRQLGGDPEGTDDGKLERPEEIAKMLREG